MEEMQNIACPKRIVLNHLLVIFQDSSYTQHRNLIYHGSERASEMVYRNRKICFVFLLGSIAISFLRTLSSYSEYNKYNLGGDGVCNRKEEGL